MHKKWNRYQIVALMAHKRQNHNILGAIYKGGRVDLFCQPKLNENIQIQRNFQMDGTFQVSRSLCNEIYTNIFKQIKNNDCSFTL